MRKPPQQVVDEMLVGRVALEFYDACVSVIEYDRREQSEVLRRVAVGILNLRDDDFGPIANRRLAGLAATLLSQADWLDGKEKTDEHQ